MIKSLAYVVRSFPEPSETFIAEEAKSLLSLNIDVNILHLHPGNLEVIHPAAQTLLDKAQVKPILVSNALTIFTYLLRWLGAKPLNTLRTLVMVWRHPSRWCYLQALGPAWWCRKRKVDFIHAHFADEQFLYASAISAWSGIAYGVTTHRYDLFENPLGINEVSRLFQIASVVVTISDFNRTFMANTYALPVSKISVVHCGIDLDRFTCISHPPCLPNQPLRLLNVGRLVSEKGQDVLLYALAQVRNRGIRFQLDIIGGGPLLESLQDLAQKLGIAEHVHFHGAQPEPFVRQLHAESHVFILPSRSEGLPVVLMEALALCTPTIATRITGIPELIEDGVSGLLIEPEDATGLANAICRIYDNPTLLDQLRSAGRETVSRGFDRRICTRELIKLWNGINTALSE